VASFLDKLKINGSKFETPFTVRHVESHLVFGPLSRHFPVAHLVAVGGILKVIGDFINRYAPIGQRVGGAIEDLIVWVGVIPLLLSRMTRRQQAILAWGATKFGLGFGAFIMMTVGTGTSYQSGQPRDAFVFFFLGLIWLPSLEFIRRLTMHQKCITLTRLVLSIPLVIIGVRGGNWHWS
jgi:hypothetical protein